MWHIFGLPFDLRLTRAAPWLLVPVNSEIQSGTRSLRAEVYDGSPDGGGSFLGAAELSLSLLLSGAKAEEFTLPLAAQMASAEVRQGSITLSCRLSGE